MNTLFGRKTNTKRALSHLMMTSALVAAGTFVLSSSAIAAPWDLTGNGFTRTEVNPNTTNIAATTLNGKAGGTGNLDIPLGQTVNIDAKLFVASDNRPTITTQILGQLNSNGTVVLIDRNGIIFGKNSRVDVGSLIASTGELDNNQALADGNAPLFFSNFGTGEIVNNGVIKAVGTAGDYGLVAFVGPVVKNNGVINAYMGRVSLAAGNEAATVDLYGDGLVELAYTDKNDALLAENAGKIEAIGGKIQMTAAAAKDVVDSVVNMKGIARADSATVVGGKIILSAKKVNVGAYATVKGNTTITAKTAKLGTTIDGTVSGSADSVKVLSDKAKIAQGLNIINTNGTIDVAAGTYNEHLVVDKAGVTINGANAGISGNGVRGAETLINPMSPGFTVTADNVTIDGMSIANALGANGYGLYVTGANNVTLKNNVIKNTSQSGIYILNSNNATITDNNIGATGVAGNIQADGIRLVRGNNATITGNTISNVGTEGTGFGSGVYAVLSNGLQIAGNNISDVVWDGVKLVGSNDAVVTKNAIINVGRAGLSVATSNAVTIQDNTSTNSGLWGVWAQSSNDLDILNNTINGVKDEYGVYVEGGADALINGNKIDNTGSHGIYVLSSDNADVRYNLIGTAAKSVIEGDGVRAVYSNGLKVHGNIISNVAPVGNGFGSGIYVNYSNDVGITFNRISNTKWDGVKIGFGDKNRVIGNEISDITRAGISSNDTTNAFIAGNTLSDLGRWGVWSYSNDGEIISGNTISNVALFDGITSENDSNSIFRANIISGSARDGIYALNAFNGLTILGNTISNSAVNGVEVAEASGLVTIDANTISNSVANGIYVHNASGMLKKFVLFGGEDITLNISGNDISFSNIGVKLESINGDLNVTGNTITDSNYDGVYAQNVNQDGNYYPYPTLFAQIEGEGEGDVVAPLLRQLTIANNDIDNSGSNGIELDNVGGLVTVDSNYITNSGYNGILAYNDAAPIYIGGEGAREAFFAEDYYYGSTPIELHIVNNTIENFASIDTEVFERSAQKIKNTNFFGFAAVNVDVSGDGYAELSGNTLGNNFEYGLVAYSGSIDLTGATNTIQNTNIGMGFYPTEGAPESDSAEYFDYLASQLSLVNDTIGTTAFIDQSELFVDLGYGAMYAPGTPTQLDGNSATYTLAGVTIDPATNGGVTSDEYDVLESFINHYVDAQNRGQFFFNILPPVSAARTIDQKDVIRDTFGIPTPQLLGGNLTITGLPLISTTGAGGTTPSGGFNPAAIEPAAGDETADAGTTPAANDVANIQPAAGGDTACWSDATASLGQGAPVTFNYGATGTALLQNAASCGTGQAQGQSL